MTLDEYLEQQEYLATHVLVGRGSEQPHEEVHPIQPEVLTFFREVIWPQVFYQWQASECSRAKAAAVLAMNTTRARASKSKPPRVKACKACGTNGDHYCPADVARG